MENNNIIYLSFDADSAGRRIGQAILHDDPKELKNVSDRITLGNEVFDYWTKQFGGIQYSSGGDQGVYAVSKEAIESLDHIRKDYQFATQGLTLSIGIGKTLSESGKALLSAKFRGKDQVVFYDDTVEQDIDSAKQRISEGSAASPEEQKLGDAYLKEDNKMDHNHNGDDCQYCKKAEEKDHEHSGDDCQYCKDAEAKEQDHEHSGDDCQYCKQADQAMETTDHEHSDNDCQYCNEANKEGDVQNDKDSVQPEDPADAVGQQSIHNFSTQTAHDYAAAGLTPPSIEKPQGPDPKYSGQGQPQKEIIHADPEAAAAENHDEAAEDHQSQEAMQDIIEAIEGQTVDGKPLKEEMDNIDDAAMPVNDNMEDNVSRPDGYEENTPADMGLGEDEVPEDNGPDLTNVLKDGLDSHADNIQKEKVMGMVGQALDGFKANKHILERAKEQAPQLYDSCLNMLKAMIEMAKMLGLGSDEDMPQPDAAPSEKQSPEKAKPEAATQEGAAEAPKAIRQ